eukprot:CAMPEP_0117439224 /NCGR_PEP_ID=MMETSP0759-20121206/2457_1 /TAXON_ID=63605 /ORGANISM="Percolomonas cosmopolitus, Strain WS" /LENGTH=565 /DNA_ID=CAMNT_0005230937 /DNA_START=61 /DNA_END=1758 /DNA_ORIENTATION=+
MTTSTSSNLLSLPHEVLTTFEEYQNSRHDFAEAIASHLTTTVPTQENEISDLDAIKLGRSKAFQLVMSGNAGDLLKALSMDPVPNVQIIGMLALAEMCKRDQPIAEKCLSIVRNVVYWIESDARSNEKHISPSEFRRVATHFLTTICRHNAHITKSAIDAGLLKAFVHMTQRYPPNEKAAGLWGIHSALQHSKELAADVLDFPKLLQCVLLSAKEPHPEVSSIAISVLGSFAKYDPQLAQKILDSGAVEIVAAIWKSIHRAVADGNATNTSVTIAVLYFLAQVIKHDENTLSIVVGQISFFPLLADLFVTEENIYIRQNALSALSVLAQYPKYSSNIISSEQSHDILPMLGACLQNPMTQWQGIRLVHSLLKQNTETIVKKCVENLDYTLTPIAEMLIPSARVNPTVRFAALNLMELVGNSVGKQWPLFEKVAELDILPSIVALQESKMVPSIDKEAFAAADSLIKVTKNVKYLVFLIDTPPLSEALFEQTLKQMSACLRSENGQQKAFIQEGYLRQIQTWLSEKTPQHSEAIMDRLKEIRNLFNSDLLPFHTPNYEEKLLTMIQ